MLNWEEMVTRLATAFAVAAATLTAACGAHGRAGAAAGKTTITDHPATPADASRSATASGHRVRTGPARTTEVTLASVPLRGTGHTLRLPRGWHAEVWAHVGDARLEAWTPNHTLLVSSPGDGTVTELTPKAGRPAAAPSTRTVVSGLTNPQGLAFDHLHGHEYLYVAASNALVRYDWTGAGTATAPRTLVSGLPDTERAGDDVHRLKNVVVGPDHTVYVDIGSSANASLPAPVPQGTLPRAAVIAFHPDGTLKRVWATGVRNGDGLAIAPDATLWTAVNERDQIAYPGPGSRHGQIITAYVNEHPPDELARLTAGRNLGWPYCDPEPDPGNGDMSFTPDVQTNPGGSRLKCGRLTPIERGLPAHSAPIGLSFLTGSSLPRRWAHGAVVAGHGSWDRHPPRPPVVYWMPWNARSKSLGRAVTLVSGLQDARGARWGRLADAVAGPDGSLYVTDDQSGAVYRITP